MSDTTAWLGFEKRKALSNTMLFSGGDSVFCVQLAVLCFVFNKCPYCLLNPFV